VCGGVSHPALCQAFAKWYSPRVWGCFYLLLFRAMLRRVFPTCVGVFPCTAPDAELSARIPHVCGGVSSLRITALTACRYSPRVWGCFCRQRVPAKVAMVFPTCVGVFLFHEGFRTSHVCIPHVCGGVSVQVSVSAGVATYSPRVWGCFLTMSIPSPIIAVFPTCVGVFLCTLCMAALHGRIPHVCGGVSE